MRKILLDTNVIVRYPKFLGLKISDTAFVITTDIINELIDRSNTKGGLYKEWTNIVNSAIVNKTVELQDQNAIEVLQIKNKVPYQGMDRVDASLIAVGLLLKEKGHQVIIASFDKEVRNIALGLGIEPFSETDIRDLLASSRWEPSSDGNDNEKQPVINPEQQATIEIGVIQTNIQKFERRQKIWYITSSVIGLISSLLAILTLKNQLYSFLPDIKVWGTIAIIFLGFSLFYWRERDKLSYGIFELCGGIGAILIVLFPLSFNFSQLFPDFEKDFKILGGIYIMVRGQDNIVSGLYGSKLGVFLYEKLRIGKKVTS